MKKQYTLRLRPQLMEKLKREAEARGETVTSLMERASASYLQGKALSPSDTRQS